MAIEICRLVRTPQIRRLIASVVALAAIVCSAPASAGMSILYSFKGGVDGLYAGGPLVRDNKNALYGVTAGGGALDGGTVYKLAPPVAPATSWTKTTLYSFASSPQDYPGYTLAIDSKGSLYGVTKQGGIHGFGSVYKLSPPVPPATNWTRTNLYDFEGGDDGAYPSTGLVFDVSGALYGVTQSGGVNASDGVVYKLTPSTCDPFSYQVIHTFKAPTAFTNASAALTIDAKGTLYGTLRRDFSGAVFSLTPPVAPATTWTLKTLLRNRNANGVVMDSRGSLYGTTDDGGVGAGGYAYKLTPPVAPATDWRFTTLAPFLFSRVSAVVLDDSNGKLYGTTSWMGKSSGYFQITPPVAPSLQWTRTWLLIFDRDTDGVDPSSLLIGANGVLYGTMRDGGPLGHGTVFQIK